MLVQEHKNKLDASDACPQGFSENCNKGDYGYMRVQIVFEN